MTSPSQNRPYLWPSTATAAIAAAALLLLASSGLAVSLNYTVASGSVIADTAEPGLVLGTMVKPTVAGTTFSLNDNQSFTFDFFDIWTDEPKINADDLISSQISATLNFSDPFTGATVNGITIGGKWMGGLSQWGELSWNGPVTISSGGRTFQITLSDVDEFNYGFGGLGAGMMCGATVQATITQISSGTPHESGNRPVPEGGKTALLLGSALVGLRALARHKRSNR
jgi:hypothetical protein